MRSNGQTDARTEWHNEWERRLKFKKANKIKIVCHLSNQHFPYTLSFSRRRRVLRINKNRKYRWLTNHIDYFWNEIQLNVRKTNHLKLCLKAKKLVMNWTYFIQVFSCNLQLKQKNIHFNNFISSVKTINVQHKKLGHVIKYYFYYCIHIHVDHLKRINYCYY